MFPFCHTFPAYEIDNKSWIDKTCDVCPRTSALLRGIPGVRTALFSKMGPKTRLSTHTGWADLANHVRARAGARAERGTHRDRSHTPPFPPSPQVLRCHLGLVIPGDGSECGTWVTGDVQHHREGEFIVFDDSKTHKAFNHTREDRYVLIVDLLRPRGVPKGRAKGGHTQELDKLIDFFS